MPRRWEPPQDAVRLIVDFAASGLLELLVLGLLDRHFHEAARQRFLHELRWLDARPRASPSCRHGKVRSLSKLLGPQVAQQFLALPELELSSPAVTCEDVREDPASRALSPFDDEEVLLHCHSCNAPILKADDIISSNFRIMTGRAYLADAVHNVTYDSQVQHAVYTSGQYTVRNVSCSHCSEVLGITYVGASDPDNSVKVGKYLLAQQAFARPACCQLRIRKLPAELPVPLCVRCRRVAARGALQLVHAMTGGLSIRRTRELLQLLQRQSALARAVDVAQGPSFLAASRSLLELCWPRARRPASLAPASLPESQGPSEAMLRWHRDLWQETLLAQFGMLSCLGAAIRQEHLSGALTAIVRFAGAVARVASPDAPDSAAEPGRVPLLLQLVPSLVTASRGEALRNARALVHVVRREWCGGGRRAKGSELSPRELEQIFGAVATCAVVDVADAEPEVAVARARSCGLSPQRLMQLAGISDPFGDNSLAPQDDQGLVRSVTSSSRETEASEEPISDAMDLNAADGDADELLLCLACATPVLKADDILSSRYRILTGPAYLARSAHNIHVSLDSHEATYSSGHYTISHVSCSGCASRLGVVYTGAEDAENQHKVGKFLLGQDLLLLPPDAGSQPMDEASLRGQLLELLRHGSDMPPSEARAEPLRLRTGFAVGSASAACAPGLEAPPRRLIVTIKRYMRCILPPVRYYMPTAGGLPTR